MNRKSTRHRAFDPDPDAPGRYCDMPGCLEPAGFRAPRSRDALRQYYWFCLAHVRDYNSNWDFYKGMTPGQIEMHLREDVSWQRPSWKLGQRGGQAFNEDDVLDPLDILGSARESRARARKRQSEPATRAPEPLRKPLHELGLTWPLSMEVLKSRYKELAREHHPDANGGDREAEERLKIINVAYTTLRTHLNALAQAEMERTG